MAKKTLHSSSEAGQTPSTGADVVEAVNYLNEQESVTQKYTSAVITKSSSDTWASIFALPYDNFRLKFSSYHATVPTEISGNATSTEYEVQRVGRNGLIFISGSNKWAFTLDGGSRKDASFSELEVQRKKEIESEAIQIGLLNKDTFLVSDIAYQGISAIKKLDIQIDDSIAAAANVRIYGIFNEVANPTSTIVLKDYTSGNIVILTRTNGVNTGVVELSGNSGNGLLKATATVNLDLIPYGFHFYDGSTNGDLSAKIKPTKFSDVFQTKSTIDSIITARKSIIEDNFIRVGCLNTAAFLISDDAYKIAQAIEKISIEVDDSIAAAANIRLYGVWNSPVNLTTTVVIKDYTTSTLVILSRPSDTRTGVLDLTGQSGDGKIKVALTINMDRITYPFSWYQDNTTSSAKIAFTKTSDVLQKKTALDAEATTRAAADNALAARLTTIETSAYDYELINTGVDESVNGYYNRYSGAFVANSNFKSRKYQYVVGKTYFATSHVSGDATALAIYWSGATFLGYEYAGNNSGGFIQFTRQILTVPVGTTHIGVTSYGSSDYYGALELLAFSVIDPIELAAALKGYDPNNKNGKKILVLGTSIDEYGISTGDSYWQLVAQSLGMTVYNEAVGSSMIRFGNYLNTIKGMYWEPVLKSLSATIADKQSILDHWTSGLDANGVITVGGTSGWKDLLLGTPPSTLSALYSALGVAGASNILAWSYETKIVAKYLDSTSASFIAHPDIIAIAHGHNDLVVWDYDQDGSNNGDTNAIAVPTPYNSKHRFCGAMNFIIDTIFSYLPQADIRLIGHYEKDRKTRIYQAQQVIASYRNLPFLKLWETQGLSQNKVTTSGYWDSTGVWHDSGYDGAANYSHPANSYNELTNTYPSASFQGTNHFGSGNGVSTNPRQVNGVWVHDLTMTQIRFKDDLHPGTLGARIRLGNNVSGWFKTL
jgi:hypothetical protein